MYNLLISYYYSILFDVLHEKIGLITSRILSGIFRQLLDFLFVFQSVIITEIVVIFVVGMISIALGKVDLVDGTSYSCILSTLPTYNS